MINKIENLTKEQEALLTTYKDRWMEIGLSTGRCDREKAKKYISDAYTVAGWAVPQNWVYCESPLSAGIVFHIFKNKTQLGASVWASVRASVWASVRASVWASVRASVWDSVWDSGYGNHDAYWLGFYNYFLEVFKLNCCEKLLPLMELAKYCGWWMPYENICIIQDKPKTLNMQDGVIHCDSAPAIEYFDGFSVWAIKGVRVDEQIVKNPETQTIEQIKKEQNEEIRRIRIERYGWNRYLKENNATRLDYRRNDIENTLEALFRCDNMTILVSHCTSTPRVYSLEVPAEIKKCEQAQNWLHSGSNIEKLIQTPRVIGRS
jgi:hypothetical protein